MPTGAEIVASAQRHLGKRYVWGAAGPNTFDCSGLVQYVYRGFGISLPHHAADQAKRGVAVSKDAIQPGDLVFADWGDGPNSHVGIAVSGNRMIDAPNHTKPVMYHTLNAGYLAHVTAVRRLPGVTNVNSGAGTAGVGLTPNGTANGSGTIPGTDTAGGGTGSSSSGVLGTIADAIRTGLRPLTGTQTVAELLTNAFLPSTIVRFVCGAAGLFFIAWGTVLMAREVR